MEQVGFLGTGTITALMVRTLATKNVPIIVSRRSEPVSDALCQKFANVRVAPNQDLVASSDIIFLCLRAGVARDVLSKLTFHAEQTAISVMAGVPLAELKNRCEPALAGVRCTQVLPCRSIPLNFRR